ncbi:hypothetical protein IWQ61_007073 [Dispira simplex]|nr:hypothetical protein IWQ61_007073 [Dispira simplex]
MERSSTQGNSSKRRLSPKQAGSILKRSRNGSDGKSTPENPKTPKEDPGTLEPLHYSSDGNDSQANPGTSDEESGTPEYSYCSGDEDSTQEDSDTSDDDPDTLEMRRKMEIDAFLARAAMENVPYYSDPEKYD